MIIDHFSTFPHGGAGTAARRLHERLVEREICSRFNYWKDEAEQQLELARKLEQLRGVVNDWTKKVADLKKSLDESIAAEAPAMHSWFCVPVIQRPGKSSGAGLSL